MISLNTLLDLKHTENLLNTAVGLGAQILFVMDTSGYILAQASSPDIPAEVVENLRLSLPANQPVTEISTEQYKEYRYPIEIRSNPLGCLVGLSFSTSPSTSQELAATMQLLGRTVTDQMLKEYELNSLSKELLTRYEELTLLYELGQALSSIFDIPTICDIAIEMAMQVLIADRAFVAMIDEDNENLTIVAARGLKGFVGWKIPVGQGVSGTVALSGEAILLDASELSWSSNSKSVISKRKRKAPSSEPTLSVPLLLPANEPDGNGSGILGVMTLAGKPIGQQFTAGDEKLMTTLAAQISSAIHNSQLVRMLRETERVQQQLDIAAKIQHRLLPKRAPVVPGISLSGRCWPAANIGGDYYDYLTDDEGRLALLIADASGHSISSALMMMTARSRIRQELALGKSLGRAVTDTNQSLIEDLAQAEMFISLFCARYEPETHYLTYVNCGHNPPFLWRSKTRQLMPLIGDGLILGVLETITYDEQRIIVESGDVLLFYTDGITEARSPSGEQFGEERLQNVLTTHHPVSASELVSRIYQAVNQFTDYASQQDDMTLLVMKVLDN